MKTATKNTALTREARQEKLRRERAVSQAMRAAFPAVSQLRIELSFVGADAARPSSQALELYPSARAFFTYPCPYTSCDGQFDLSDAVQAAVDSGLQQYQGVLECGGLRARDHTIKEACQLHLHYEVRPVYEGKPRARKPG